MLRSARRGLGILTGLLAMACATPLEPAPQAQAVPGLEEAARRSVEHGALPPLEIEGSVQEPVQEAFGYRGFVGAPHYAGRYRHFPLHAGPYPYDPFYYDTYYDYWAEIDLPTQEMIGRALPEGVLEPGGYVQGWLYFEKVSDDASSRVVFRADLVDQASGRTFGEVRIPFRVE